MLRTYKLIDDPIFSLHQMTEHLVCQVWCNASREHSCQELLMKEFEAAYLEYAWLKDDVDGVYAACIDLNDDERAEIREAFFINNDIEDLCDGGHEAIEMNALPDVVSSHMLPALKQFYYKLLDRAKIPGDKLKYYNRLVGEEYINCPCCGLSKMEPAESVFREDNDHFFPVSTYPFAAVNFKNLLPVCEKCNKKRKNTKTPQEHNGVAYYGFARRPDIEVTVNIVEDETVDYLKLKERDIELAYSEDTNKNSTWNYLFGINERYNKEIRDFSYSELRALKNRIYLNKDINKGNSYDAVIDFEINNYDSDKYKESKFLKAAFLREMKTKPEWLAVYARE